MERVFALPAADQAQKPDQPRPTIASRTEADIDAALSVLDEKAAPQPPAEAEDAHIEFVEAEPDSKVMDAIDQTLPSALGPTITGTQNGMFRAFDEAEAAPSDSSSGSRSVDDLEKDSIVKQLKLMGLKVPEEKLSGKQWRDIGSLLVQRKWPEEPLRQRIAIVTILEVILDKDLPYANFVAKSSVHAMAREMLNILRRKGLRELSQALEKGMPNLPREAPPPPPSSKGGKTKP